jgi:Organic solvent tolerance protein OstA
MCVILLTLPVIVSSIAAERKIKPRAPHVRIAPTVPAANRYQEGKVFLEHADLLHYEKIPVAEDAEEIPEQYQVLNGNVVMRKGDMFMYCDSAYFYEESNSFDAFGNVRMEQGDTLFVYADELNYDGASELAILYADFGKKVRLINKDVKLETDVFNYDMLNEVGYYTNGGVLTDKQNKLTSVAGEYHPNTKDAYFNYNVHLRSLQNADTLHIYTDSLDYNTATHIAKIVSKSEIVNSDGVIYSTSGIYNTDTGVGDLYKRSLVVTKRGSTLTGDTLFYDRTKGFGEAFGGVIVTDSVRQVSLHGEYGFYDEIADSAFVTIRALAKEYSRGDTLYLHGDTINAYTEPDSTKVTNAFHRVRFYRSDMQGICDSLSMTDRDSIMYMYRHPVVWSDERQIFGNVIYLHLNDSTIDWARLPQFGFTAEHIAEDCYNQLSGTDLTAWFNDSTLRRLYVEGNVQLIMFPMENDSTYNKYVQTESSYMDSYYDHNTVDSIHFWPETTTKVVPLYLARKNSYFLPKFAWYEDLRPWSPEDVFNVPQAMIDLINSADPVSSTVAERKTKESERRRPNAAAPPEPVPKTEKLPDKPDEPEAPDKPDAPDAPKNSGQDEPQHDQSTES